MTLTGPHDLGKRLPACDKFPQERQEKCLAETTDRRLRFQVERPADDVAIELVEDDPVTQIEIEARPAFFDRWYFHRETICLRLLRRNGEEQCEIPDRSRDTNADCHRSIFAPFRFTLACYGFRDLPSNDRGCLDLVISTRRFLSSLSA